MNLKTNKEIEIMREGGRILGEIINNLKNIVQPGITTNDLEKLARELVLSYGVESSFLGYDGFPAVLCVSINEEIVHGVPSDRVLKDGDVLKIDMGVLHKGFHSDSAITVLVGISRDSIRKKLIQVTKESLEIGISMAKVGNTLNDIGSAIQNYVEKNGFNVVRDLVGHGIGKGLHEAPQVLNYAQSGESVVLVPGLVIAIEPMVVTGKWAIKDGKDGYAFITKDGGLAAHFEHTVAITESGPQVLTQIN